MYVDDHCTEYGYVDSIGKYYAKSFRGCKIVFKTCDKGYGLNNRVCTAVVVTVKYPHCE